MTVAGSTSPPLRGMALQALPEAHAGRGAVELQERPAPARQQAARRVPAEVRGDRAAPFADRDARLRARVEAAAGAPGIPASATYRVAADLDRAFRNWFRKPGRRGRSGFPRSRASAASRASTSATRAFASRAVACGCPGSARCAGRAGRCPGEGSRGRPDARPSVCSRDGPGWMRAAAGCSRACSSARRLFPSSRRTERAEFRQNGRVITVSVDGNPST